jgi:anti-sigma factor RsiW
MVDPSLSERGPHDAAEELLPWYATGQLDADDRARVERHLYSCASCREQLAVERRLADEFQAMSPEAESGWARLKARIDPSPPVAPPRPGFFEELRALISRPTVVALATAQLVFVLFAGGLLMSLSQPAYHALGSAPVTAAANVIVMFRGDATEEDVRGALHDARATIVGGPTSTDAYLLHVEPAQRDSALSKLRKEETVQLVEPLDGVSQ